VHASQAARVRHRGDDPPDKNHWTCALDAPVSERPSARETNAFLWGDKSLEYRIDFSAVVRLRGAGRRHGGVEMRTLCVKAHPAVSPLPGVSGPLVVAAGCEPTGANAAAL
jgi:hypothetical protein